MVCGQAQANDYILSRAVLEDRSGWMTIDQVVSAKFEPVGEILSKGYTPAAHWLKITVRPRQDGGELLLRIRPTFLDEVRLYQADQHGNWREQVSGDRIPFLKRDRASVNFEFSIKPPGPETSYFLRLKTTSSSILSVEALEPHEAQLKEAWLALIQVLFLGFMLWLLFWAINDYLSGRQSVVAWFAMNQCVYVVYVVAITGRLAVIMPSAAPGLVDTLTTISICMATLFGLINHRVLLALFQPSRLALHLLDALILAMLMVLALIAIDQPQRAVQINAWIMVAASPMVVALAFSAQQNRRVLRVIYGLLAASLLVSILPLLGWINAVEWTLNAWMFHGFISAGLMFMLLNHRSKQLKLKTAEDALHLELTRCELAVERRQRETQNRFMSMLNHELKTPLSAIRMALGMKTLTPTVRQHVQQAVGDIDNIVHRTLQLDQLEQNQLGFGRQACSVNQLLNDIRAVSPAPARVHIESETLPDIETDPQLLDVVLRNLLDNAFKYGDEHSAIHINAGSSAWQEQPGILVSIANRPGPAGLPDPSRVFEKYYRGPAAHGTSGSGLGLYLVQGFVEHLGGWVRYVPSSGEVKFEVWIPC